MVVQVGDTIPQNTFRYIPYSPELEDSSLCGLGEHELFIKVSVGLSIPHCASVQATTLNTDEWKGKKVVLVSVPGAFTPTCHVKHMPPFVQKYDEFKAKGVDVIAFVAANDPWVMSAWGRVNGVKDKILMLSDTYAKWTSELGLSVDLTAGGMGIRTGRWAIILEDLKVTYVGTDTQPGQLTGSGADVVLAKL